MSQKYNDLYGLLSNIFYGHRKQDFSFTWDELLVSISQYIEWLNEVSTELGLKKCYSTEHLAEQLFLDIEFNKSQCKYHLNALIIMIKELEQELKDTNNKSTHVESDFVKGKLALLKDLVWDGFELIGYCEKKFLSREATVGLGRRRFFSSNEIFYASIGIIRRNFSYLFDDITYSSLAVFQIRQAIETKVLNLLGIGHIINQNGEMEKFKLENLIEFIDKCDKIEFPVKKSLLLKITKWTNFYIHRGIMNYHWMIMLAQQVLTPLFSSGKGKRTLSVYGSVKIDENYFKNHLEEDLLSFLELPNSKIIKLPRPEAIIEPLD